METLTRPVNPRDHRFGPKKKLTPEQPKLNGHVRDCTGSWHLRVLVADGNEAERQLMVRQLREAWPFTRQLVAECATDGVEALKKVRRHAYAFVVLEGNLPHVDGTDVLQAIRAEGLRVPIIVVSSKQRAAIASDLESLAAAFINKSNLDPTRFQNAMAAAILLQQAVFGLVPADPIRVRNGSSAPTAEDRFVGRSSQLLARPTALVELR